MIDFNVFSTANIHFYLRVFIGLPLFFFGFFQKQLNYFFGYFFIFAVCLFKYRTNSRQPRIVVN